MKTYAKMAIVLAIAVAAGAASTSVADEPGIQMMQRAEAAEGQTDEWTFISADERYGKFYDPHRVHVVANADVKGKLVPAYHNESGHTEVQLCVRAHMSAGAYDRICPRGLLR